MKAWMAVATAAMALASGAAQAGNVGWSVTVGSPRPAPHVVYAPPPVVYAPPLVVHAPPPVVYRRAPVVLQPGFQPVFPPVPVMYGPPIYRMPPGHIKHLHQHAHRYPGAAVVHAQPRGYYRD